MKKGSYRLLFRWQQFRADYCGVRDPNAERIRTGVALEIEAQIKTLKSGLDIANLGALTNTPLDGEPMPEAEIATLDYGERYIAFVDVLGFSQLVFDADARPELRHIILGIIDTLRSCATEFGSAKLRHTQFSDSLVISTEATPTGLFAIFRTVMVLGANLLEEGIMLRGGIVRGNIHHSDTALFGVGMIEAYKMDQGGGSPRIALCARTAGEAHDTSNGHYNSKCVYIDPADNVPILNILYIYSGLEDRRGERALLLGSLPRDMLDRYIGRRRQAAYLIMESISKHSRNSEAKSDITKKWIWLRSYWDCAVAPCGHFSTINEHDMMRDLPIFVQGVVE